MSPNEEGKEKREKREDKGSFPPEVSFSNIEPWVLGETRGGKEGEKKGEGGGPGRFLTSLS